VIHTEQVLVQAAMPEFTREDAGVVDRDAGALDVSGLAEGLALRKYPGFCNTDAEVAQKPRRRR
jgi:hypothetical protein